MFSQLTESPTTPPSRPPCLPTWKQQRRIKQKLTTCRSSIQDHEVCGKSCAGNTSSLLFDLLSLFSKSRPSVSRPRFSQGSSHRIAAFRIAQGSCVTQVMNISTCARVRSLVFTLQRFARTRLHLSFLFRSLPSPTPLFLLFPLSLLPLLPFLAKEQ